MAGKSRFHLYLGTLLGPAAIGEAYWFLNEGMDMLEPSVQKQLLHGNEGLVLGVVAGYFVYVCLKATFACLRELSSPPVD